MPRMEPTRVMTLGRLGAAETWMPTPGMGNMQPRLRTSFINPPRTTPIEPQNLLRQTMLGGLGTTGRMFMGLGQAALDALTPTEDAVNQYLEAGHGPGWQASPSPNAPILPANGSAQLPNGDTIALQVNEEGLPVDVISTNSNGNGNGVNANAFGAGFQIPFGGQQYKVSGGAALGYGSLSLLSGLVSAWHGYQRDRGSWGSAIGWFVLGSAFPIITPAVAFLAKPGFGKAKRR